MHSTAVAACALPKSYSSCHLRGVPRNDVNDGIDCEVLLIGYMPAWYAFAVSTNSQWRKVVGVDSLYWPRRRYPNARTQSFEHFVG